MIDLNQWMGAFFFFEYFGYKWENHEKDLKKNPNENGGTSVDLALVRGLDECFWSGGEDESVSDLIEFKDNVNNGTSYSEMTVFLDSDSDFTGRSWDKSGLLLMPFQRCL